MKNNYNNVVNHLCGSGEDVCDNLSAITCPYIQEVLKGTKVSIETFKKFPFIFKVKKETDGTYVILGCNSYKLATKGQNELQKEALLNQGRNDMIVTGYRRCNSGRVLTKKIDTIVANGGR
ncbi:MAG TPA: hypothetical protein PKY25_00515 [Bacilli bacterium]|nr:hypothetical protein [Bacilli bacterium]